MLSLLKLLPVAVVCMLLYACGTPAATSKPAAKTARQILGDSNYLAISYGGYRQKSRDKQPTLRSKKEDLNYGAMA